MRRILKEYTKGIKQGKCNIGRGNVMFKCYFEEVYLKGWQCTLIEMEKQMALG
jgi:hypothetical protein